MAEHTEISWADSTLNIWEGCQETASPACIACYARERNRRYAPKVGPGEEKVAPNWGPHAPRRPIKGWRSTLRAIAKLAAEHHARTGRPWFVFVNSLSDFFDNRADPEWRREALAEFAKIPHCTFLLLTKRPQNIVKLFEATIRDDEIETGESAFFYWPRNAAIGCTVVTQAEADRDIPVLLEAKAALKPAFAFVSMEPLLEAVDIRPWLPGCYECATECGCRLAERPAIERCEECGEECGPETEPPFSEGCPKCGGELEAVCPNCNSRMVYQHPDTPCLDWVITGGETDQGKHKARETPGGAFEGLLAQCQAAGVPFHMKQMTRKAPIPAHLQIQERPHVS